MNGLRIAHPTERSVTLIIPHPGDPRTGRKPKDYHVTLDSDGFCIVSHVVWHRLQEAHAAGFRHGLVFANEVPNPPTQGVGLPGRPQHDPRLGALKRVGELPRDGVRSALEQMQRNGQIPKGRPRLLRFWRRGK